MAYYVLEPKKKKLSPVTVETKAYRITSISVSLCEILYSPNLIFTSAHVEEDGYSGGSSTKIFPNEFVFDITNKYLTSQFLNIRSIILGKAFTV